MPALAALLLPLELPIAEHSDLRGIRVQACPGVAHNIGSRPLTGVADAL